MFSCCNEILVPEPNDVEMYHGILEMLSPSDANIKMILFCNIR